MGRGNGTLCEFDFSDVQRVGFRDANVETYTRVFFDDVEVSAMTHYEADETTVDRVGTNRALDLQRDHTNVKDSNAIKVLFEGKHIGFIAAAIAADVAPLIDAGSIASYTSTDIVEAGFRESNKRYLNGRIFGRLTVKTLDV